MATKRDYYDILGVGKNSNDAELKQAYRKQALQWHPDRNKSAEATEKFKEINEAYEILSNKDKRAAYDQYGHAAFAPGGGFGGFGGQGPFTQTQRQGPFTYTYTTTGGQGGFGGFGAGDFSDPFEIFEAFFGGASPFRRQRSIPRYGMTISFDEAMRGTERTIVHQGKEYKVKIPAGVDDGSRIKFTNFYVSIDVKPSDIFKRDGYDLIVDKKISFTLAALGGEVEIPTIDHPLKIKIRPGTQPSTLMRLRGKGIPHPRGYGRGDLYIRLLVEIPTHLSRDQKRLLEELEKAG